LWVAEQALRCRDLAVLLLWAPKALPDQLRRLQVAAQALGERRLPPLVFVFRPAMAAQESSPAPLRIGLALDRAGQRGDRGGTAGRLAVQLIKRRGPVLTDPVLLDLELPPALVNRHEQPRELTDHLQHLHVEAPSTLSHVVDSLHPFVIDPNPPAAQHLAA
jgi:protein ImuA